MTTRTPRTQALLRRPAVPILLALVIGLVGSAAISPAEAAAPRPAVVTGIITGPTGAPMFNAVVDARSVSGAYGSGAGTSGAFSMELPAGTYVFRFTAPWAGQLTPLQEWSYNAYQVADATSITLVAGQKLTLNTQLEMGASISGQIRAEGWFPYKSTEMYAWHVNPSTGSWQFVKTMAGPNGSFDFNGLTPGTYVICAQDNISGYGRQCWGATGTTRTIETASPITVVLAQRVRNISLTLVK